MSFPDMPLRTEPVIGENDSMYANTWDRAHKNIQAALTVEHDADGKHTLFLNTSYGPCTVLPGTYTGDGTTQQAIILSSTILAVLLFNDATTPIALTLTNIIPKSKPINVNAGYSENIISSLANGIMLIGPDANSLNQTYYYLAFVLRCGAENNSVYTPDWIQHNELIEIDGPGRDIPNALTEQLLVHYRHEHNDDGSHQSTAFEDLLKIAIGTTQTQLISVPNATTIYGALLCHNIAESPIIQLATMSTARYLTIQPTDPYYSLSFTPPTITRSLPQSCLVNGNFEIDTTGWTASDATLASISGGQDGNCLEMTNVWDNLITNGEFTSNTTGWTATNATLASIAGGQSGNCLEITDNRPNLVTNGNFDTNLTSWTVTGEGTATIVANGQSGNCLAITSSELGMVRVAQDLTTEIGQTYDITWYMKDGDPTEFHRIWINGLEIYSNGWPTKPDWTAGTVYFTATDTTTTLELVLFNLSNVALPTTLWDTVRVVARTTQISATQIITTIPDTNYRLLADIKLSSANAIHTIYVNGILTTTWTSTSDWSSQSVVFTATTTTTTIALVRNELSPIDALVTLWDNIQVVQDTTTALATQDIPTFVGETYTITGYAKTNGNCVVGCPQGFSSFTIISEWTFFTRTFTATDIVSTISVGYMGPRVNGKTLLFDTIACMPALPEADYLVFYT